ncbi:MAG TPA: hypothetical protein VFI47_13680 [Acidimicrobiales bacterium]|nr:hypothetical protein [Acidimicrobiales bacterium]
MTHPEVASRAARARWIAQGITEGPRPPAKNFTENLSRHIAGKLLPPQVVPLLLAAQCGTATGTVRVGDVELAKQLVDPDVLGDTDDAIAQSLMQVAASAPPDLAGLMHAMANMSAFEGSNAEGVEKELRALIAECRDPWRDPALDMPVALATHGGASFPRAYVAPTRVWARAIATVLTAVLAMCVTAYLLRSLLH